MIDNHLEEDPNERRKTIFNKLITFLLILVFCCIQSPLIAQDDFDEESSYESHIENRDFPKALDLLKSKDQNDLTAPEKKMINILTVIVDAESAKPQNNSIAVIEEEVDPTLERQLNQIYWTAQSMILNNEMDQARELLLYILYLNPGYFKAQYLLEKGYNLTRSDYKPYDVATKLKSRSRTYFYGGNYLLSIKDLEVLVKINKDDPALFEQLGSNYYMIDEKKKAIDFWSASLLLNPENNTLKQLIQTTKDDLIEAQKKLAEQNKQEKREVVRIDDPQVMGVFKSQSDALELMTQLKARGLKVLTEQNEKGQIKVIVSRKELMSKSNQK